jgi:hypothetical protein
MCRSTLDKLEKGDLFTVDCHEETLQVHSDGPFVGAVILNAYDDSGAQWTVADVDGDLYLGYSQTSPIDDQPRAKEIGSVSMLDDTEQTTLVTATDGGNGRYVDTGTDYIAGEDDV